MLRVFKSKPELSELFEITSANLPLHLDLHTGLQFSLHDMTPFAPIEVYAYPWPHPRAFAYIVRNKYIKYATQRCSIFLQLACLLQTVFIVQAK